MHIKQVIIRGFKTYKDQIQLTEDFDKGVNVVLGFNGSGKSNFFNAILFVISDRYGTLRNETRKSLLHEGSGPAVLTAFVEIVFENSDRKLPIDKDEVRIRRTIAAKKDDYSLDGKNVTRNEIFKLLESCGFAKSNPYYIVQQGKVGELTMMTDANRLELFKEISGASTYDERRTESERILEDLRVKRDKTSGIITVVRTRISSLEEEQRELLEYQQFERRKRCLEFVMADRDWKATQERIEKLDVQKVDETTRLHEFQRELAFVQDRAARNEKDHEQASSTRSRLEAERQEYERMSGLRLEELTRAKLEHDDEKRRVDAISKNTTDMQEERRKIETQMEAIKAEIHAQRPGLETTQTDMRALAQRKNICQVERDSLLAKQGRGSHYTSIAQRNKFLTDEITRRVPKRDQQAKMLEDCRCKIRDGLHQQENAKTKIGDHQFSILDIEQSLGAELTTRLEQLNRSLDQASDQTRLLLDQRANLVREKDQIIGKIDHSRSRLEGTMPRPVRHALTQTRKRIEEWNKTELVFGTLLELITVDPEYHVAVESAAGSALFNLLVTDDDIAADIVKYVRQNELGSITCTPLNQVRSKPRQYPKLKGCKPLVDVIKAPKEVLAAVQQVFGRFMVCNSLELCDVCSHKHELDAVTLEGDRVSCQGTMTGGYQDPSRYVRLKLATDKRESEHLLAQINMQLPVVETNLKASTDRVENLHEQKRQAHTDRQLSRAKLAQATDALHDSERHLRRLVEDVGWQREREHEVSTSLAEYRAGIEALTREKESKTLGKLSNEEHARVESLSKELTDVISTLATSEEGFHKLQRELRAREQHLNGYLQRRHQELGAELLKNSQQDHQERFKERERAVIRLEAEKKKVEEKLASLNSELRVEEEAVGQKKRSLDEAQKEGQRLQATISDQIARVDDIVLKVNSLAKKKAEYDDKLRKLTIVASDLDRYKAMTTPEIIDELRTVNKSLHQFEHVNKKAIDQFSTFKDQLEELDRESAEITEAEDAIRNFMVDVDAQKEELLTHVLDQVRGHFQDVFNELVLDGSARLVPVSKVEEDIETLAVRSAKKHKGMAEAADGTKGVRIEVSFTGQSSSFLTMSQLSGGQKTVVALALIFAIQRLEPAPFYLFDEIDAALDTQYRTAVARLIQKDAAKGVQMIITTFRPEVIESADKFYRVSQRNRVSTIDSVSRIQARMVIEQQTALEGIEE